MGDLEGNGQILHPRKEVEPRTDLNGEGKGSVQINNLCMTE